MLDALTTQIADQISGRVFGAFAPLFGLGLAVVKIIAFVSCWRGVALLMLEQRNKGFNLIMWSLLGYFIAQWIPGLFEIIDQTRVQDVIGR